MILKQRLVIIFDLLAIATLSYPFIFTSYKYKNLFKENLSYLKKLVLAMRNKDWKIFTMERKEAFESSIWRNMKNKQINFKMIVREGEGDISTMDHSSLPLPFLKYLLS